MDENQYKLPGVPVSEVEFCCGRRRCPTVQKMESGDIVVGGREEGYSKWTQDNLRDFVKAARDGKFDELLT